MITEALHLDQVPAERTLECLCVRRLNNAVEPRAAHDAKVRAQRGLERDRDLTDVLDIPSDLARRVELPE